MKKKLLYLTGTRADFGKIKSLIENTNQAPEFEVSIFITGMHLLAKYGMTSIEVERLQVDSTYKFINQRANDSMDIILAKTIQGLSEYVHENRPDLIIVHGDRVEAMAGAIVGSLNNILVAHIEGGEVSGTIDELIRHSISKMSHFHFVCNQEARVRLIQLGEAESTISVIGSPDLDIMGSPELPTLEQVKNKYDIHFDKFSILMYHPVTTDLKALPKNIKNVVDGVMNTEENYVVIYPNNDAGTDIILNEYARLSENPRFRVYPSIRFEYFLILLKNASSIIGNSSAGVREAPFYGVPSINLGSRQNNRATAQSILNIPEDEHELVAAVNQAKDLRHPPYLEFGDGDSANKFLKVLRTPSFWETPTQKVFVDRV